VSTGTLAHESAKGRWVQRAQWISVLVAVAVVAAFLVLLTREHRVVPITSVGTLSPGDIETVVGQRAGVSAGDGGPAASASLDRPAGLAYDRNRNLLIVDSEGDQVRMVSGGTGTYYGVIAAVGSIYTIAGDGEHGFAGDGGAANRAELALAPSSQIVADAEGNLLIADTGNGRVRVVAGSTGTFYGQTMIAGDIYTLIGGGTVNPSVAGGVGPQDASLAAPVGIAVDANGNVVMSDADEGSVDVLAEATGTFWGHPMISGLVYRIGGTNRGGPVAPCTGGEARKATADVLGAPAGLDIDPAGNVVVALSGAHCVAVISNAGGQYYGLAMSAGRLYPIAGGGDGTTADRGLALKATLVDPVAVTLDGTGDVIVADASSSGGGNRVRVIGESNVTNWGVTIRPLTISTVTGTGAAGFSGDRGPATLASINQPSGVALDDDGDLLVADSANNRVREVIGSSSLATSTSTSAPLPTAVQAVIPAAVATTTTTVSPTTTTVKPTTTTVRPTTTTTTTTVKPTTTTTTSKPATSSSTQSPTVGYRLIGANGEVAPFGDAPLAKSTAGDGVVTKVVAVAAAPHLSRFWEFSATGLVEAFNGAVSYGSPSKVSAPIAAAASTPDGRGYWLAGSDGKVYPFGDASVLDPVTLTSSAPIVSMAVSAGGRGYWLVAADGTVYPVGDAMSFGAINGATITTMASTSDGEGYWLASSAGQVYAFGDANTYGGTSGPVVAIVPTPDGAGYWLVGQNGRVADGGSAAPLVSRTTPTPPIVAAIAG
jgi:hypothetical protein